MTLRSSLSILGLVFAVPANAQSSVQPNNRVTVLNVAYSVTKEGQPAPCLTASSAEEFDRALRKVGWNSNIPMVDFKQSKAVIISVDKPGYKPVFVELKTSPDPNNFGCDVFWRFQSDPTVEESTVKNANGTYSKTSGSTGYIGRVSFVVIYNEGIIPGRVRCNQLPP
jgi:hypothetical protein